MSFESASSPLCCGPSSDTSDEPPESAACKRLDVARSPRSSASAVPSISTSTSTSSSPTGSSARLAVRRSPQHKPHFVPVKPNTEDVQLIVWKIARRIHRLLDRRGLLEEGLCPDEREHPFHRASVSGRTILGERPNQPVARLRQLDMFGMFGNPPTSLPRRCAVLRGFNLYAGVRVGRHQRDRLER
jgi:hypothetical protein